MWMRAVGVFVQFRHICCELGHIKDHLRIVPSQSWLPKNFSSLGIIPKASMAFLSGPALEITVPAILEEERRKRFNIQGEVWMMIQYLDWRLCWGWGCRCWG